MEVYGTYYVYIKTFDIVNSHEKIQPSVSVQFWPRKEVAAAATQTTTALKK